MLPIWELHADRRWSGAEGFVFCSTLGTGVTCPRSRLCQKSMQIRDWQCFDLVSSISFADC